MPTIEEQAAAATIQLAQMTADYQARPEYQLARAQERAAVMGTDIGARMAQDREIARLQKEVDRNQAAAESVYLTDEQRVDNAISGITDHLGAQVTTGDQIPLQDFNRAVADLSLAGVRDEAIASFLKTGQVAGPAGETREDQIAAADRWNDRLMRDPEMQKKLLAGDPQTVREFNYFSMYAASVHER